MQDVTKTTANVTKRTKEAIGTAISTVKRGDEGIGGSFKSIKFESWRGNVCFLSFACIYTVKSTNTWDYKSLFHVKVATPEASVVPLNKI